MTISSDLINASSKSRRRKKLQPIKCPSATVDDNISHDLNHGGTGSAMLIASAKVTKVMFSDNHTPTVANKDALDVNSNNEFVLNLSTGKSGVRDNNTVDVTGAIHTTVSFHGDGDDAGNEMIEC